MSQSAGKLPRDRKRRISDPAPYKRPAKTSGSPMPATRHSPTRPATAPADSSTSDVLRELALLRRSIEGRFLESSEQVGSLKTELLSKLDANDQAVSDVKQAITDVTLSVDENQRAIQVVWAEVERREVELPQKVKAIVQEALAKAPPRQVTGGQRPRVPLGPGKSPPVVSLEEAEACLSPRRNRKDEAYDTARRSLRIWPVSREGSLEERVVEFLVNELLMDQQHASGLQFAARRVGGSRQPGASSAGVKDEVLLTFNSTRDRDEVRSFAKNLERRGRGLRLEVPNHLWPSFRVLQNLGYELRQRNTGMKRNVLFDDDARDLKLDIYINEQWKTVFPEEARTSLSKLGKAPNTGRLAVAPEELDALLASSDMDVQEL